MTREEHTEKINEIIKRNRQIKSYVETQNNKLSQIRDYVPADVEEAYQRGLEDAWECSRRLLFNVEDGGMSTTELCEIFHRNGFYSILKDYSVQEVMKRIEDYEKQKDAIKVGDELEQITNSGNPTGVSCIVTYIGDDKFNGITEDGKAVTCSSQIYRWWRKTGRTFPQIAKVLKAMREGT